MGRTRREPLPEPPRLTRREDEAISIVCRSDMAAVARRFDITLAEANALHAQARAKLNAGARRPRPDDPEEDDPAVSRPARPGARSEALDALPPDDGPPALDLPPVLDDFGQPQPQPTQVGPRKWQPSEPRACDDCTRRFWPTHPRNRYCPDCRAPGATSPPEPDPAPATVDDNAESVLLGRMGEHLDHLSREVATIRAELAGLRELLAGAAHVRATERLDRHRIEGAMWDALDTVEQRIDGLEAVPAIDALDVTLGQALAALAAIGRGEVPPNLARALGMAGD